MKTWVPGSVLSRSVTCHRPRLASRVRGVRAVTGTPENTRLVLEAQATDSVSGETLAKVVRAGTGETLKKVKEARVVTLESVKPLIDEWAEAATETIPTYIKAK